LFNCSITILGNDCCIEIGRHCILSNTEFWIEDDGGIIKVGSHTTAEGGHLAATEGRAILIGDDCMFSHGIEVRNGDSHAIEDAASGMRINEAMDVVIGNHVWLGANSTVLKGTKIDDGSIIATGSVVTQNIESHSIAAGVPARIVKHAIRWERERAWACKPQQS